LGCGSWFWRL